MRKSKGIPRGRIAGVLTLAVLAPTAVVSAVAVNTTALREAVTLEGVRAHQQALQDIADANGGTRASATPGYDASAAYVVEALEGTAYQVTIQPFQFPFFQEDVAQALLDQVAPNPTVYTYGTLDGFLTMEYSGSGDVTELVQPVDLTLPPPAVPGSTSGCEAADFVGFTSGNIALIQRGTCSFFDKASNAEAAGASGVIIFNEGQDGRTDNFGGTLGAPGIGIPVVAAAFAIGNDLADLADNPGGVTVHLRVSAISEIRETVNVIAESPGGRADRAVVVGAHLDSVPAGPGINDNGSGSATILEIARQISALGINPRNKLRFAWWGAEESGLWGSQHYVDNLTKRDIKNIAVNLNFDMVGSPNFVRFVYDGDGSATPLAGPNGSKTIESVFVDYFDGLGLPTEPTAFDGRSDYGPFIAVGIPAGGLFTGAEEPKTAEEAAIYGGTAGLALDPCYHQACDTFDNNSDTALDQMSDAAAHAVLTFAMTTSAVNGTDKGLGKGTWENAMVFRGNNAVK